MLQKLIALPILYGNFTDFYAANNFSFLVVITCFASFAYTTVLDRTEHWLAAMLTVLFVLLKESIIIHYKVVSN